tara:strand:+ start:1843 stop:2361 length:519 start_codon:yes stop_codon:yes gene_type:complete
MSTPEILPAGLKCRWSFEYNGHTSFADSLEELLDRPLVKEEITEATENGRGYEIAQTFTKPRTDWPMVLIIDRSIDPTRWIDHPTHTLHWTDSSGSRSVWWWGRQGSDSYEDAESLPVEVFEKIAARVAKRKRPVLCMRREDPGLGIFIPEIDLPVAEAGGIPDGVLVLKTT